MNKIFNVVVIAICIVFMSCAQSKNIGSGESLNRQWMLKTLLGVSYDELLKAKASINLSDLEKTGAEGGCNKIFFSTKKGTGNKISFSNIGSTRMFCEGRMRVEESLLNTLSLITTYELFAPHQIAFKDASGKVIITAVAADWD